MNHLSSREQLLTEAVHEHSGAILHYLYSLCNDWQIAEDLSQNLWSAVHKHFDTDKIGQKNLLYHKAKQVFIDYYRKIKCRVDIDFTETPAEPSAVMMPTRQEAESYDDELEAYQRFWLIFYPDAYDENSKRIFWLHERYGYTMDEVSNITGIPKSSAHDKLKRIKQACRNRLAQNTN